MSTITNELAQFVLTTELADMPTSTQRIAQSRLAVLAGLALGGCQHPAVATVLGTLEVVSAGHQVGILGREERLCVADAPIVTATSIASACHELEQTSSDEWPDGPVMAAVLAVGEYTMSTGSAVLEAFVVGAELGWRIEQALTAVFNPTGWVRGAIAGRLGAAGAAGRLLDLDHEQMVSALGLAATQVAGLAVSERTPLGAFTAGKQAGDGAEAALLASRGFEGPPSPLEGRRGLAEVLTPAGHDLPDVTEMLGREWFVPEPRDYAALRDVLQCPRTFESVLNLSSCSDLNGLHAATRADIGG